MTAVRKMTEYVPRPCVLCGPSGSGKSTLIKKLMEEYKEYFGFSVSRKLFICFLKAVDIIGNYSK